MEQRVIRRRAARLDVTQMRQALSAAAPVNSRVGALQGTAARINALASRPLSQERRAQLLGETRSLAEAVAKEWEVLDQAIKALTPAVAKNGRILDTQRALLSLSQGVERTLALLNHGGSRAPLEILSPPQHSAQL